MYRATHKGCDFNDDQKLLKANEFEGISVLIQRMTLVEVYKSFCNAQQSVN